MSFDLRVCVGGEIVDEESMTAVFPWPPPGEKSPFLTYCRPFLWETLDLVCNLVTPDSIPTPAASLIYLNTSNVSFLLRLREQYLIRLASSLVISSPNLHHPPSSQHPLALCFPRSECLLTMPRPVLEIRTPAASAPSSYLNNGRRRERARPFTTRL